MAITQGNIKLSARDSLQPVSWLALADTLRTVSAGYDEREVDKIKEVLATA